MTDPHRCSSIPDSRGEAQQIIEFSAFNVRTTAESAPLLVDPGGIIEGSQG